MNDSELLDIQIAHEQEMLDRGVSRYRKHVTEAQQKGQESDTQHGSLLMKKTIDKLRRFIDSNDYRLGYGYMDTDVLEYMKKIT